MNLELFFGKQLWFIIFGCFLSIFPVLTFIDKEDGLICKKKPQLSNRKDFNIWNHAYNLISYFNYFNFTSSCVKMLVKGLCGRRMEIAVACKKWAYLFLICSTSDGKNLSALKLRMSSSFMPRVVTWPEQQVSSYAVWTLGNILLLEVIQTVEFEEYNPRFVECEMRQAVTDNLEIFKIQGSILGFLKMATCALVFYLVFFCSFSSHHSVQETEATSVSSVCGRMCCWIR